MRRLLVSALAHPLRAHRSSAPALQARQRVALSALLAALTTSACEVYDPPPRIEIEAPEGGGYLPGQQIRLRFSERIEPDSLSLKVWPNELNEEKEFNPEVQPLISTCTISSCGSSLELAMGQDGRTLWMTFDPMTLGRPGSSLILDVQPGLSDEQGKTTGVARRFAISFRSPKDGRVNTEPVPFDQGTYVLVGEIDQPIPATLNLIADIRVTESGLFALAGAEGEHIPPAPKNTANPDELFVNTGTTGFPVFIPSGFVLYRDGERLLETDPVNIKVPLGFLDVTLEGVRLNGRIFKNPMTQRDRIETVLSFEKLFIQRGARVTEYAGGSAPMAGDWVDPSRKPEGHPLICGDPCGLLADRCELPSPWPPEGFCE